jgi:hypothetical protein
VLWLIIDDQRPTFDAPTFDDPTTRRPTTDD